MKENKTKLFVWILAILVVVLIGVVAYLLAVRPAITGYATNNQIQGYQIAINDILTQVQQNGYVAIPVGNQTLYLAPFNPQQVNQQAGQQGSTSEPAQ